MLNYAANHIVALVSIVFIALFVNAVLGYANADVLEVLKAVAMAQQNS